MRRGLGMRCPSKIRKILVDSGWYGNAGRWSHDSLPTPMWVMWYDAISAEINGETRYAVRNGDTATADMFQDALFCVSDIDRE